MPPKKLTTRKLTSKKKPVSCGVCSKGRPVTVERFNTLHAMLNEVASVFHLLVRHETCKQVIVEAEILNTETGELEPLLDLVAGAYTKMGFKFDRELYVASATRGARARKAALHKLEQARVNASR